MTTVPCPICNSSCDHTERSDTLTHTLICKKCGKYNIHDDVLQEARRKTRNISERQIINASYFLNKQNNYEITENNIDNLLSIRTPSFQDRYQNLLLALEQECRHMGEEITLSEEKYDLIESVWAFNFDEFMVVMRFLESEEYITISHYNTAADTGYVVITPKGWSHIEEIKRVNPNSTQGFIAMWFDESMAPLYDLTIAPAIVKSGYTPHRVDRREHAGKVDDEIIAQIRRSKFVVADFTGHRGGVYYEAGFAHGLGLPVIMTCREDHLNELHFDIRQYNCILWKQDNLNEFQERLQNRIEAILGRGPIIHDA